MLDENDSTTAGPATTTESRPRRRAAGRPAGPPAAVTSDIFSPPGAPEAAEPDPVEAVTADEESVAEEVDEEVTETEEPTEVVEAEAEPAEAPAPAVPLASGLMFQAPDTTKLAPPRPRRDDDADTDELDDDTDNESDSDEAGGAPRRRRSRGGRRRRKPEGENDAGDASADAGDDTDDAGDQSGDDDQSEGGQGGTRRRRSRRRAGDGTANSPDDPENTVVRVREGRQPSDEITGVTGSTRLEAKKQRRREGREAGRRRAPIVSEAEFLARRESVNREMVVRQHDDYTQIAVLEDKVLVEHYVARESQTSLIGNVYIGKVQNVLPSMEAAFVDIGAGRNAVLYAGEVDWSALGNGKARKIEDALTPGQSVLVQVSKDPIGQKGARLTSQVSLPGRFLVLVPGGQTSGISRKLPDTERARLKALLKEVLPENAGVIVRTAAEGATEDQLTRDVSALSARWEDIERKVAAGKAPELLYAEPDLMIKVVRDLFNEDFAALVVEGADAWDNISGYVQHVAPDLAERLRRWEPEEGDDAATDAFTAYRIDEQIHKALDRKVWLPSGGSLVIDRTEAMTVVDVNTGKFTGSGGNLEETVTKNNLEAAEEIVRQLRLRDIGGIIVIDFIDMVLESNRDLVLRRLVECLGRDRTRHQVAEVTSLGLVQMTRKRIGTGLLESFSSDCEHCKGRGVVLHAEPIEPKASAPERRGRRGGRSGGGNNGGGNNSGGGNNGGNGGNANAGGEQKSTRNRRQSTKAKDEPKDEAKTESAEEETTAVAEVEAPAEKAVEVAETVETQVAEAATEAPAEETTAPVLTDEGQAP